MRGGDGDDLLKGSRAYDVISGEDGDDKLTSGGGAGGFVEDKMCSTGERGDDRLVATLEPFPSDNSVTMRAGSGDDVLAATNERGIDLQQRLRRLRPRPRSGHCRCWGGGRRRA